jgi:hypothetical protein
MTPISRRWPVLLLAALVAGGCAQMPQAPPTDEAAAARSQQRIRAQHQARLLLDQVAAQTALFRLARVLQVREDHHVSTLRIEDSITSLVRSGVRRAVDLEQAAASRVESEIALHAAAAGLQAGLTRYCERYGQSLRLGDRFIPKWGPRWPATLEAALAAAPSADPGALRLAWLRVQRSLQALALHEQRVLSIEKVRDAYRQQFDIGQRSLSELVSAERALTEARIDMAVAQAEQAGAQADLMSFLGGLTADELRGALSAGEPDGACRFDAVGTPLPELRERARRVGVAPQAPVVTASTETGGDPDTRSEIERLQAAILAGVDPGELLAVAAAGPASVAGAAGIAGPRPAPTEAACGTDALGQPAAVTHGLPRFDWPPGPPSYEKRIPARLLRADHGTTNLGTVAQRLTDALDGAAYLYSFLSVPDGFALVTRMEQILPDGSRSSTPWSRELPRAGDLGFMAFIRALFTAPPGLYRVIAIVVTEAPRDRAAAPMTERRLDTLLSCGSTQLPEAIAAIDYTDRTRADALIYEFSKTRSDEPAAPVVDPRRSAQLHLEKAGIWYALQTQ